MAQSYKEFMSMSNQNMLHDTVIPVPVSDALEVTMVLFVRALTNLSRALGITGTIWGKETGKT